MIKPYNFQRYRSAIIGKFNISAEEFDLRHRVWVQEQGQSLAVEKSFVWHLLEGLTTEIPKQYDDPYRQFLQLKSLYQHLWCFLVVEQENGTSMQTLANYYDLKIAEQAVFKTLVRVIAGERCDISPSVDGLTIPLEEALQRQPIPYEKCTRPLGCICCYGFQGERDENDKLIMK